MTAGVRTKSIGAQTARTEGKARGRGLGRHRAATAPGQLVRPTGTRVAANTISPRGDYGPCEVYVSCPPVWEASGRAGVETTEVRESDGAVNGRGELSAAQPVGDQAAAGWTSVRLSSGRRLETADMTRGDVRMVPDAPRVPG